MRTPDSVALRAIAGWRGAAFAAALTAFAGADARAAELPVACVAGTCGPGGPAFVTAGRASASTTGTVLRIDQQTERAILNWSSFDVGRDSKVVFNQPSTGSIALNRIYQGAPSRILGVVEANGQIYLVNPNGVIFGKGSRVKAATVLASTLDISDATFQNGILSPDLLQRGQAALVADGRIGVVGADGKPVLGPDGKPLEIELVVEEGAEIKSSAKGGQVILASRTVRNAGLVEANDGQVIVAAGEKVYLQASGSSTLRGLLVEVDQGGKAWNQLTGTLSAARGNVTMVGLAVNQDGRASASTSIAANGSIRLLARDSVQAVDESGGRRFVATRTGTVQLGGSSQTSVLADATDKSLAVDDQAQSRSSISIMGREVYLRSGARVTAPSGQLSVQALSNPSSPVTQGARDPGVKLRVESGVVVDLAGLTATAPVSRNMVAVELRSNELRDSPEQREGALRGQTVVVDARVGTPIADVSAAIANTPRGLDERLSRGGDAVFSSEGDVVIADGSRIDVSGGGVNYTAGVVSTSGLITPDGRIVPIGTADPNAVYTGVLSPLVKVKYDKWGVVETTPVPGLDGQYEAAYTQGASAGSVQIAAPAQMVNGTLLGHVTAGPYQRTPGSAPAGGTLIIGQPNADPTLILRDYRAPSIEFSNAVGNVVVGDQGSLPANEPLVLSTDYLVNGGFTRTELYSNGAVSLPAGMPLHLQPGTSLSVTAHRVDILSDFVAAGGTLALLADLTVGIEGATLPQRGIYVGEGVRLDVSGNWVNDALLPLDAVRTDPVYRNGGTISLALNTVGVASELSVGAGSLLAVNGGGWLDAKGRLRTGQGGSLALRARGQGTTMRLGDDVRVEGFAATGSAGGSLDFESARIDIAGRSSGWAMPGSVEFDGSGTTVLHSNLFSDYGLSRFTLTASGPMDERGLAALQVDEGVNLELTARTYQLDSATLTQGSTDRLGAFAATAVPELAQRNPSALNLRVAPRGVPATNVGSLAVGVGASIVADPRSTLTLDSVGGIDFRGSVTAAAGTVTLHTTSPDIAADAGFDPGLRVYLSDSAVISVTGTVIPRSSADQTLVADMLAGGSVNLLADRGSVVVEDGSIIDVRGTQGQTDVATGEAKTPYRRETVASAAGSVTVRAPESIRLDGAVFATAGTGTTGTAAGGVLDVSLTRITGFAAGQFPATFPNTPRVLRLGGSTPPDLGAVGNGVSLLDLGMVRDAGFDLVRMHADARIELAAGAELEVARGLFLDTPVLEVVRGGNVKLAAPYVRLGNASAGDPGQEAVSGDGTLNVQAGFIELLGDVVTRGIGTLDLESTGDLRLRGVERQLTSVGSLQVAGDIHIAAARVYGSTLTDYTVSALGTGRRIAIEQNGVSAGVPLSVASRLAFHADDVVQAGTVYAPFGRIEMQAANALTLANGSLTSVSADGGLLPFGRVENGATWTYSLSSAYELPFEAAPQAELVLDGKSVTIASGATADVRGGGDIYAYEWQPGAGGSRDALAPGVTPGLYAVLPSLQGQVAPYDPQEFAGFDLAPGSSIYLATAANGLAAGTYALLPARYALLPGAYLVSATPGYDDIAPGTSIGLPDGGRVVGGSLTFGTTGIGATRLSGFAVHPGTYGRELAQYVDYRASTFVPSHAAALDQPTPRLPADAGRLSIVVQETLDALGEVLSAPGKDGRGATVAISAPNLRVVDSSTSSTPGTVDVRADTLSSWDPAELVLGGTLNTNSTGLVVTADTVTVASGVALDFAEIVAVARQRIELESGAQIVSTAPAVDDTSRIVALQGASASGAAFLAVSDRATWTPNRGEAVVTDGGAIVAAPDSVIGAKGALTIDAPGHVALDGTIDGSGAHWRLASSRLALGGDDAAVHGLALDARLLAQLQQAGRLSLISSGSIDVLGPVAIGNRETLASLSLQAAAIRNTNSDSGIVSTFAARTIGISGLATTTDLPTSAGVGTLALVADVIEAGPGRINLAGFENARLDAATEVRGLGDTQIAASGNLQVQAPRVTADSGATLGLTAGGGLLLGASLQQPGTSIRAIATGGALELQGAGVSIATTLVAPSGRIEVRSSGDLAVGPAGMIDVAARAVTVRGQTVAADGGWVRLVADGDMTVQQGARISVAGVEDASAGHVDVAAGGRFDLAGALDATAADGAIGGSFAATVGELADFQTLYRELSRAGFNEHIALHTQRGDLQVVADDVLGARQVELSTDAGRLVVAGRIDAVGTALGRSLVRLFGGEALEVASGAVISADAGLDGERGGRIELGTDGQLDVRAGSTLSAAGGALNGELVLRAPVLGNDVAIGEFSGTHTALAEITVEPVLRYDVNGLLSDATLDDVRSSIATFVDQARTPTLARLGLLDDARTRFQPGVELRSSGDLELGDWSLDRWRFAGEAPIVTVRAAGSIDVAGTVSDGYRLATDPRSNREFLNRMSGPASTLRIVAGADLAAADPLGRAFDSAADLRLAAGSVVRTGAAGIDLVAGRNIVFAPADLDSGTASAVVFNAGNSFAPATADRFGPVRVYPGAAGAVRVVAGNDVVGTAVTQSVTEWQNRTATPSASVPLTGWSFDPGAFRWNLGSVGGAIEVSAGGSVVNLSAAAADAALQGANGAFSESGGGYLQLAAGGDIGSAMLYVARGTARIAAADALTSTRTDINGSLLGSSIGVADARIDISARQGVALEAFYAPSVISIPDAQRQPFFYRYGADAAVRIRSAGGDLVYRSSPERVADFVGYDLASGQTGEALTTAPPSLDIAALAGNVVFDGTTLLYPSDRGQLRIVAARDITALDAAVITMSDAAEQSMATPMRPTLDGGSLFGEVRLAAASARHAGDDEPVLMTAGGDISNLYLLLPKPATLRAGRDARNVSIVGQNLAPGDVTSVDALRDIRFDASATSAQITLGGPGRLDLSAGRNLDLGFSAGVTTTGRLTNPNLTVERGADVSMIAGIGPGLDAAGFLADVVDGSAVYRQQLLDYLAANEAMTGLTYEQARIRFLALDGLEQRPYLLQVFFKELLESGREANKDPALGFSRGYAAIDAMLPGSRPAEGATSPYHGDLTLPFSRIYTLAGGDISLVAPGGLLNVGLANPPTGLGVNRKPSELGIVTQKAGDIRVYTAGDVLVNQSRMFTLLGGSILVWSTAGDIDAGRGAKSAISAPPPSVIVDSSGRVTIDFSGAVAGSGIRTILTDDTIKPGDVDLIAPAGFVNAGDAGIGAAGNLNVAAQTVVGLDNIQVGGVSTGVPAETSGLGASLSGASNVASSASQASEDAMSGGADAANSQDGMAASSLSWLDVAVVGLGEEVCSPRDLECLKRQPKRN